MHEIDRATALNYSFVYYFFFIMIQIGLLLYLKIPTSKNAYLNKLNDFSFDAKPLLFVVYYLIFLLITFLIVGNIDLTLGNKRGAYLDSSKYGNIINFINIILVIINTYYLVISDRVYFVILSALFFLNLYLNSAIQTIPQNYIPILLFRLSIEQKGKAIKLNIYRILGIVGFIFISLIIRGFSQVSYIDFSLINVLGRFTAQGQLFWVSIEESFTGNIYPVFSNYMSHFLSINNQPLSRDYGLGHFMVTLSPQVASYYVQSSVTFAGGSPAIFIYYFGLIFAAFIMIALGYLVVKYFEEYIRLILEKKLLEFIALNMIGNILFDLYINGDYTRVNLRFIILLLFYYMVKKEMFKVTRPSRFAK